MTVAVRVGWGFDAHRFGGEPPVLLAGVVVDAARGLEATSDGDVLAHAVADAVLGTTGRGDLGTFFPSSDPRWRNADSMDLLRRVVAEARQAGVRVVWVDATVVAESVRVDPYRARIAAALAAAVGIPPAHVSMKATSTDGMGSIGADEGMAAMAVVTAAADD